jgi:hypothetical protein
MLYMTWIVIHLIIPPMEWIVTGIQGTNHTSFPFKDKASENQKSYVLPHMQTLDLGQMQQCGWTWIT